jgi:hypothetical protein
MRVCLLLTAMPGDSLEILHDRPRPHLRPVPSHRGHPAVGSAQVVVVASNMLVRHAVRSLLGSCSVVAIVAEANTDRDLCAVVETSRPDLLILDLGTPGDESLGLLKLSTLTRVLLLVRRSHPQLLALAKRLACRPSWYTASGPRPAANPVRAQTSAVPDAERPDPSDAIQLNSTTTMGQASQFCGPGPAA